MIFCKCPCASDLSLLCSIFKSKATTECNIDILKYNILNLAGNKTYNLYRIARIDIYSLQIADINILSYSKRSTKSITITIKLLICKLITPINNILIS